MPTLMSCLRCKREAAISWRFVSCKACFPRQFSLRIFPSNNRARRRTQHRCPTRAALFVPDITPTAPTEELRLSMQRAALEIAKGISISELCLRVILDLALAFAAAYFSMRFVSWISRQAARVAEQCVEAENQPEQQDSLGSYKPAAAGNAWTPGLILFNTAVAAIQAPARYVLPLVTGTYALQTIVLALQIAAEHDALATPKYKIARHMCNKCTVFLSHVEANMAAASQLLVLLFGVWFCLSWNQQIMETLVAAARAWKVQGRRDMTDVAQRVLVPVSNLASWAITCVGLLAASHLLGWDVRLLMTIGGISTLAIGFGAQQLTSNVMSALVVFFTRVFVVGERVTLQNVGGGPVAEGTVERVDPMRTLIRTDAGQPVALPNAAITNFIVINQSRMRPAKEGLFQNPRQYSATIAVRCEDVTVLPELCADVELMLAQQPHVDNRLPHSASVINYERNVATIALLATTVPSESRDFAKFTAHVLVAASAVLQKHGLSFA